MIPTNADNEYDTAMEMKTPAGTNGFADFIDAELGVRKERHDLPTFRGGEDSPHTQTNIPRPRRKIAVTASVFIVSLDAGSGAGLEEG
jgi:hypothetical protein